MISYKKLTPGGKKRRLRMVAEKALESYDIDYSRIEYFTQETNIFYKVFGHNGQIYGLKICQDDATVLSDNLMEAYFLRIINENSDITAPTVVNSKSGESVTIIDSIYTDTPKRIILYQWLDGLNFSGNETEGRFFRLGKLMAKLHAATKDIQIPKALTIKKWDCVFYFTDEKVVYHDDAYAEIMDMEKKQTLDKAIAFLDDELRKFYLKGQKQLLHGDINPWNVLIKNDELQLIDFEDSLLGCPIVDIAIALFYYKHKDNYEQIKTLILDGYSSIAKVSEYTEYEIDLLITARRVNFINFILLIEENPNEFITRNILKVKAFFKQYKIDIF